MGWYQLVRYQWDHTICGFLWPVSFIPHHNIFIHAVACISTSFLFEIESYSILWRDHILFTCSSVDGCLGGFHFQLLWFVLECTWVYSFLCEPVLGALLGLELLDPLFILHLNSGGTIMLFSMAAAPFDTPISSVEGFPFLRNLVSTCYCLL